MLGSNENPVDSLTLKNAEVTGTKSLKPNAKIDKIGHLYGLISKEWIM